MQKSKIFELVPGIFFNIVLMLTIVLGIYIPDFAPKYYAGDPNFDLEKFKSNSHQSLKSNNIPGARYEDMKVVLPPKVISRNTSKALNLMYMFGNIWAVSWSVYAFIKRNTFASKNIVWFGALFYLLVHFIFGTILLMAAKNIG